MHDEAERQRPYSAVFLVLVEDGRVLLSRRRNTGHRDGDYSLVAGHLEVGESVTAAMVREAREEVGVDVDRAELTPVHVVHRDSGDRSYFDVFFRATDWDGAVRNREPEKCGDLRWCDPTELPDNTVPYVEQALRQMDRRTLSEFGWADAAGPREGP